MYDLKYKLCLHNIFHRHFYSWVNLHGRSRGAQWPREHFLCIMLPSILILISKTKGLNPAKKLAKRGAVRHRATLPMQYLEINLNLLF